MGSPIWHFRGDHKSTYTLASGIQTPSKSHLFCWEFIEWSGKRGKLCAANKGVGPGGVYVRTPYSGMEMEREIEMI